MMLFFSAAGIFFYFVLDFDIELSREMLSYLFYVLLCYGSEVDKLLQKANVLALFSILFDISFVNKRKN